MLPSTVGQTQASAVILAMCYSDKKLGAAAYDQKATTVQVLQDTGEEDDFRITASLVSQIEPTVILICKSQDLNFIRFLDDKCKKEEAETTEESVEEGTQAETVPDSQVPTGADANDEEDEEDDFDPFKDAVLHFLATNIFRFDQAKIRISELFSSESLNRCESDLVLQFRVDTSSSNMVRAFGALLKYMDAVRIGVEYDTLNVRTPVTAIKTIVTDHMIEMDWATYRALDIFGEDKKKEGGCKKARMSGEASLFSLMNRCRSTPGKHMLMRWFERPTLDKQTLQNRQKAISYFIQDCNMDVTSTIHQSLGRIRNVRAILKRMRASTCKVQHWKSFYDTLVNLVAIGRCLQDNHVKLKLLDEYKFAAKLAEVAAVVSHICDLNESEMENRLVVNAGVDADLDETKQIYRQLPKILTKVAHEESTRLGAVSCSVGYVPMVGYLMALPIEFNVEPYEDVEVVYCTEDKIHAKSLNVNKLDEELGDVKMQIIDKETTIALRLQQLILNHTDVILTAMRGAAVLDAVISMAMTARYCGWNCPSLVNKPVIEATQSVHPLTKIVAKNEYFVPNPISSGEQNAKIKIFTGPNACGKSVYMKQVAILVFLAHIGSFVPADRAIIGPVNRIITRVYTVDGALDGMSTFAKDLAQLAVALRRANQFSLVIIDEFGKGTLTEVGLSLLTSSLNFWIDRGPALCPHVLVSSHFHALSQFVHESELVAYQTFEVIRRGARLDFQFRLVPGLINCSHAAYTALRMGIPEDVVDRANEVYSLLREGRDLTELPPKDGDDKTHDFLLEKMDEFISHFESWDIQNDHAGLLAAIKQTLLQDTEHLVESDEEEPVVLEISQATAEDNEEPIQACVREENEDDGAREENEEDGGQEDNEEDEASKAPEEEEPASLAQGIIKTRVGGKREERNTSNLSVSFAASPIKDRPEKNKRSIEDALEIDPTKKPRF